MILNSKIKKRKIFIILETIILLFLINSIYAAESSVDHAFWANIIDNPITHADLNDRVKLVVTGQEFNGKDVLYQIYKDGFLFFDKQIGAQTTNKGDIFWIANPTGNYYFKATVQGGNTVISGNLQVTGQENNNPPVAKIEAPKNSEIYLTNSNIEFRQSSYDIDNYINYSWDFGDGNVTNGTTVDFVNYNATHLYNPAGQKNIVLNVLDERGVTSRDLISILIIDNLYNGKYAFAEIKAPLQGELIKNGLEFDATDSFAIEANLYPSLSIKCIGGNCPAEAKISGVMVPITDPDGKRGNFDDLNFTWIFDNDLSKKYKNHGLAGAKYRKLLNFPPYGHSVTLTVEIKSGISSSTAHYFYIISSQQGCSTNGNIWTDLDGTLLNTFAPNNACKMGNTDVPANPCCPDYYDCIENSNNHQYQCQFNFQNIGYCDSINFASCNSYIDKDNCTASICGLGGGSENCGTSTIGDCTTLIPRGACNCNWSDAGNYCYLQKSLLIEYSDKNIEIGCSTSLNPHSDCIDGLITVTQTSILKWEATSLSGILTKLIDARKIKGTATQEDAKTWLTNNCNINNNCFSGTREVICGEEEIKLNFFNWINIVIIIVIIFIIYCTCLIEPKQCKNSVF